MTIGVYMRVSTRDQKNDAQRGVITRWLKAHGHDPSAATWFEDQETGKNLNRGGLKALNAAIFAGDVKTVVVWKLDRLARSQREGINTLYEWCDVGESTVNTVVGKRFGKRQQMRWSKQGAHLMLQTRTRTLDGTLRQKFEQWYPGMKTGGDDKMAA